MKVISRLKKINSVLMWITAVLYITIYLGLMFQIVLGAYQLIAAIIVLSIYKELGEKERFKILLYWFLVLLFGALWKLDSLEGGYEIFPMVIYPIGIAIYFTFFLEKLKIKEKVAL